MADPNAGVGWYEFTTPTGTTGIAYVHEGGDVFVPDGGWGSTEPFHLAASRGNVHRLIRADTLDVEAMARSVADNLYGQDVHTLVMRRPGETYRDQAERIGQWTAEIVLAKVLGAVAECPICGSTRPGGTPSCDCAAHRDVPSTEAGEADPGLLVILLGVIGAVLAGAGLLALGTAIAGLLS